MAEDLDLLRRLLFTLNTSEIFSDGLTQPYANLSVATVKRDPTFRGRRQFQQLSLYALILSLLVCGRCYVLSKVLESSRKQRLSQLSVAKKLQLQLLDASTGAASWNKAG